MRGMDTTRNIIVMESEMPAVTIRRHSFHLRPKSIHLNGGMNLKSNMGLRSGRGLRRSVNHRKSNGGFRTSEHQGNSVSDEGELPRKSSRAGANLKGRKNMSHWTIESDALSGDRNVDDAENCGTRRRSRKLRNSISRWTGTKLEAVSGDPRGDGTEHGADRRNSFSGRVSIKWEMFSRELRDWNGYDAKKGTSGKGNNHRESGVRRRSSRKMQGDWYRDVVVNGTDRRNTVNRRRKFSRRRSSKSEALPGDPCRDVGKGLDVQALDGAENGPTRVGSMNGRKSFSRRISSKVEALKVDVFSVERNGEDAAAESGRRSSVTLESAKQAISNIKGSITRSASFTKRTSLTRRSSITPEVVDDWFNQDELDEVDMEGLNCTHKKRNESSNFGTNSRVALHPFVSKQELSPEKVREIMKWKLHRASFTASATERETAHGRQSARGKQTIRGTESMSTARAFFPSRRKTLKMEHLRRYSFTAGKKTRSQSEDDMFNPAKSKSHGSFKLLKQAKHGVRSLASRPLNKTKAFNKRHITRMENQPVLRRDTSIFVGNNATSSEWSKFLHFDEDDEEHDQYDYTDASTDINFSNTTDATDTTLQLQTCDSVP